MTKQELREHYAGLAMQAIMVGRKYSMVPENAAIHAVRCADALITALACKHEKTSKVHGVMTCEHCKETILCEEDLT